MRGYLVKHLMLHLHVAMVSSQDKKGVVVPQIGVPQCHYNSANHCIEFFQSRQIHAPYFGAASDVVECCMCGCVGESWRAPTFHAGLYEWGRSKHNGTTGLEYMEEGGCYTWEKRLEYVT